MFGNCILEIGNLTSRADILHPVAKPVPDTRPAYQVSTIKEVLESNDHIPVLRKEVQVSPKEPGVYRWYSANDELLYVGKAKELRSRLSSYVSPAEDANLGPWKRSMLRSIAKLEYTVTRSEIEALILETNLIKEHKPKYNVLMKDDKNYVYVRISKQPYPEVSIVRQIAKDAAKYYGPFLSKYETRRMLEVVHTVHPFMTAKETVKGLNAKAKTGDDTKPLYQTKPLGVQIGKHCGLGTQGYTKEQYHEAVEQLQRFLRGERTQFITQVEEQMQKAAAERKFEKAAKLRDTLQYMRSLEEKQTVSDTSGEDTDYLGLALMRGYSMLVLLREREGKLIAEQSFSFKGKSEDVQEVLQSFITQYYSENPDIPQVLVLSHAIHDAEILAEWLEQMRGKRVEIRVPERGKKVSLLELAQSNAQQKVQQLEASWEAELAARTSALEELKEVLQLPDVPERIEGYDISHLGGTETVGSMVVLRSGKADTAHYRNFTIHSLAAGTIDDYASLREVLRRRLQYLAQSTAAVVEAAEEQGYTVTKAKKADTAVLQELLHEKTVGYKDHYIAQKDTTITAILRKYTHDGITEIDHVYFAHTVPQSVRKALALLALKSTKKGKIYLCTTPELQEFWSELGAKVINDSPKALAASAKKMPLCMHIQMSKQKPDVSLSAEPNLLVIDGGKGQLNAVKEVLDELRLDIPVIGLAKREEEVFIPGKSLPIEFGKDSQAKFLLMRLRNEAHRFANLHREKRGFKAAIQSSN